jgi:hypothetical protein
LTIIRNHEMLNQVQHYNRGAFSVTLNLFQGLINTDISIFDYGLWFDKVRDKLLLKRNLSLVLSRFLHV